jgi:hypothetical protein
MANSDKNIRITTSKNKITYPNIVFTGSAAGSSVITLEVLDDNTLSFTSNEGQVFSIDSNLSTGTIWAVSDISGVPLLSSSAGGTVGLAVYGGIVGIGQTNPLYKLDLKGSFGLASSNDNLYNFIFNNSAASGSNSLQIRSANSLLLYNSGNTFYTGFKSNAATNITYTLPTTDGSSGQFLQTNGSGTLTWATATGSGGTGSTAGVGQGGQYEMAYYPGTGLSVIGSNTFTNNTVTGVVSITHATVATDSSSGAFKVTGGVGIGGSLYVGGIGASITGVTFSNSTITRGTWNGTVISTTYGGTGQNLGSSSGVLTISSGTVSASTTSSAILSAITDETGSGVLVFNTQPSFGTGVTTGDATFAVFNTNATTINAFGAATAINIGAATGKATFNSTDNSISSTTGGLVVSGGAGFAKSISVAGRLQLLNGANVTAFVSSGTGNTVYTLPATTPATGSSVLQSTAEGVMSWVPMVASSSSGAGSGTVAIPNAQHSVAYYAGTGASVSGSATFTNNTSTGVVNISHATVSTTSATGALTVSGGVGIGGSLYVASASEFESSAASINVGSGALVVTGGVGIGGSINVGGASRFSSSATAISIGTGALTVTGGAGIAGSLYVGEASRFTSSIASLNSGTGALTVTGGVGIGGSLNVALPSEFEATTAAIDVGSGALVVTGGVGIGGSLFVGGASRFTSSAVSISVGTGALTVTGGVGIGGSVFTSTSVPSSISGVVFNNGIVTVGSWSATAVTAHYGGTGLQAPFVVGDILYATSTSAWGRLAASSTSGQVLTSNGAGNLPTYQAVPPAAASSVAVAPTVVNASFFIPVVNSASSSAVGLSTVSTLVINPSNNLVTLSGLAVTAVTQTTSSSTGALVVTYGAAVGQTLSVGGSLNIFNGANYTGFRFTGSASTTYTLPIRTPTGTGTSYLSSSVDGVMAWVAAPTSGGSGAVNSGTATFAAFYASTSNTVSENANLQFTGAGVSVGGNINSSSTLTGSIYVFGGLGISGNAFIGGTVNISSTTPSNIANLLVSSNLSAAGGTFTSLLQAASIRALAGNTISFQTIDGTNAAQINNTRVAVLYSTVATASNSGALQVSGGTGIGGSLYVASASQFESSAASINVGSGALVVTGGVGVGGSINVGGASRFSSSTTAISIGTGALTVTGGAGIAGSLYVGEASRFSSAIVSLGSGTGALTVTGGVGIGGSLYVANTSRFESSVISSSVGTGALTVTGGVGIGGSLYVGDSSRFTSSTIAISSGTGALTVTGGVGIGGSLYVANTSRFESSVISSSVGTGALVVTGGVGIGGSLFVGSASRFTSTNISSSSGTGALTVTGGVGIGGSLYVADTSRFESNINSTTPGVGGLIATGGVGIGLSVSIGGRLQMFNGSLYTAFASAQSGVNTTYILPPTSPATGSSVLQSTSAGVMSWVPMTAGGGPSGTINSSTAGKVAFYTGTTTISGDTTNTFDYASATGRFLIANPDTEAVPNPSTLFLGIGTGTTNFSVTGFRKTLAAFITNNAWTDGDLLVLGVAGAGTTQKFAVDYRGYAQIGVPGTGFTLPVTNGTSGQVLTANTNGVASWTTVSGSSGAGSGTVAIPNAQYSVAYYAGTGASVSGSNTFTNNTATGVVEITHTTESTSTTSGAFQVDGGAGIAKSLFVGTTLSVGTTPGYNIPNNLASFVSTVNSYNQLVIQNKSNGTSASANLVVNNDVSTDAANYGEIGMNSSTFSGSGALSAAGAVYLAAHTAPLVLGTVTSHPIRFTVNNGATDTIYIHEAGTAISVFTNFDLRSQNKIRFYNSDNTRSTSLHAGANTASYALALPTAPVGVGYSVILVDTTGQMYFAPAEGGLATTSVTGNRVVLRNKMEHHVWMSAGYTPLAAGPDNVIYRIPDSSEDGISDLTFSIKEFTIRVETPSAGSSRIQLERSSTRTGAFTLAATGSSLIGGSGLTISGAGIYLTTLSTFPAGIFVTSGDLLRLNYNLLNATHANFSVAFTLNEV